VRRGRRREESDHLVALRSRYLYDSQITLAGTAGAHEKGGVEGEVGRFAAATSGAHPGGRQLTWSTVKK
jgi:hypothetical protein